MLYRFEDGNPRGVCRVKNIQTAWYDMDDDGSCYDESFSKITPDIERLLAYLETEEDLKAEKRSRSRVFINMDDGDSYELILQKVTSRCNSYDKK